MKTPLLFVILVCLFIASCTTAAPSPTGEPLTVQYTASTIPWLAALYVCAGNTVVTADQRPANLLDPHSVDLAIRLGQPEDLSLPVYQIGTDDILVIVNPQNPVKHLNEIQVRNLFDGQIRNWKDDGGSNSLVQVWAFSAAEDVQTIFTHSILNGSPVTSTARLATSPDEMIQGVSNDIKAIGIINRRLKTSKVTDVFTVPNLPILVITRSNPPVGITGILGCLQK